MSVRTVQFSASGLRILERNYLEVYKYEKWSEREIPEFRRGQKFQTSSLELVDSETSPPKLLTEADLISLMEKHGIGSSLAALPSGWAAGWGVFPGR